MAIPREEYENKLINIKMNKKIIISLPYIAGFLEADGTILAQLIKRPDYKYKFQIRVSIVFFQKTERLWFLIKLKNFLKYGYIRNRKDGISEYIITAVDAVNTVLIKLYPHLVMKKKLARLVLEIIKDLKSITSPEQFIIICEKIDKTSEYNYSKKRKNTSEVVRLTLNIPRRDLNN